MYGVQNPCPVYGFLKQLPWIELNKQAMSRSFCSGMLWVAPGPFLVSAVSWTLKPFLPSNCWSPASALAGFPGEASGFLWNGQTGHSEPGTTRGSCQVAP